MADSVKNDDLSQVANQSDNENHSHSKQPLPSIHPDDARDKVFTAIMKALLKVGNKPSSPRELSNVITKYKYATLGGATPFATVSSRISQHFKRAAEHNPPRAPLLAKHVDQRHARKINYSLVTDSIQSKSPDSPSLTPSSKAKKEQEKPDHNIGLSTKRGTESSDSSPLSSEEDEAKPPAPEVVHHTRSMDKRKRSISKAIPVNSPPEKPSVRTHRPRRKTNSQYARRSESDNEADDEAPHPVSDNEASPLPKRQRKSSMVPSSTLSELSSQITPSTTNEVSTSSSTPAQLIHATRMNAEESESDSEFSDYHEEMLKGDLVMEDVAPTVTVEKKLSSRRATVKSTAIPHNNTTTSTHTATSSIQPQNNDPQSSPQLNLPSYTSPKSSPRLNAKKSNNGLLGDQDLWLPYSFDQDFDNVFLSDNSCVGNNVPLNIATPESISVSELDNYFASTTNGTRKSMTLGNHQRRPNNINGDFKGSPLLQKVLLPKQPINDESGSTHPQADVPTEHRETVETDTMEEAPSSPALETPDDSSIGSSDEDGYSSRRIQPYHIVEKVFGNLRVYELDSPGDIPNTKVMRFISTTDGSNNNIARRTRNAEIKKSVNSQHFYLDEGYVNATQLRKAAQPVLGKGSFDIEAESERNNAVVTITSGHSECRGAWVPLHRARELVEEYEIESSLGLMKLLSDEPIRLENQKEIQDVTDKLAISSSTVSTPPSPRSLECNSQPNGSPTVAMMTTATAESSEELSSEQISESEDDDSFVKFEDADSKTETFVNTQANIAPNVASRIASSVAPSTGASAPVIPSTSSLVSAMTTSPATAAAVAAASSNVQSTVLSAVEILKTLNISNLNLQTLHQIAAAIPNLAHLAPTIKSVSASTNGKPTSNSSSPTLDIKAALSHFSALEALLKKEPSKAPTTTESTPTSPSKDANQPVIISTTVPTTPHMYITIIDNVAVYVTVLSEANGVEGEHLLMRRVDNGYINGTSLLKAGGIETEQERSIVLSLEVGRVRIPNKASRLHGTWIPLRRAQALAATCSLQHKLGAFLNDTIDTYFPNPLPISLPVSKKSPEGRLTAVTLTSLRSSTGSSKNGFLSHQQVSSSSGPSSPNNNNNNNNNNSAQLQQLLLSHNPSHSLNLKAPMLGCFDEEKKSHRKKKREISVVSSSNSCGGIASPNASVLSPVTIKSGPASDDASPSPPRHNLPTPDNDAAVSPSSSFVDVVESDEDTDTDTDVEEVREHMKKMRAAAMDAMENGSSMDLDEIISRARSPLAYRSTLSVSQATPKRTTRLSSKRSQRKDIRSIMEDDDDDDDEEDEDEDDEDVMVTASRRPAATRRTYSNVYNHHSTSHHRSLHTYGRRKPTGGKWAGGGSKLSPGMIKKSASWNGSISKSSTIVLPSRRNTTKSSDARKTTATTTESNLPKLTLIVPSPISEKSATVIEEDEDEEIDIGGSDRDDDLR